MSNSPTAAAFRAAFRRPSVSLAEIMWRWSAGGTATALFVFGVLEYLHTLPVTNVELLFLRSRHPYLVAEAIAHILRGSLNRVVLATLLAAPMLCGLWIAAASIGRIATVRVLLDYFRAQSATNPAAGEWRRGAVDATVREARTGAPIGALIRLNFLRAGVALAAVSGFLGAMVLAGFVSPDAHPRPGLAFSLFLPLAGLVCYLWWALNWLLSLAGVFAVRDGEDAVGALCSAADLCRERTGAVFAVTTWIGLAHLICFAGATVAVSVPLGFAGIVPWRLIVVAIVVVTLVYFALADWLYMARLAGYVYIAETPEWLIKPLPPVPPPTGTPLRTTIDRDELILSDVPSLAVET